MMSKLKTVPRPITAQKITIKPINQLKTVIVQIASNIYHSNQYYNRFTKPCGFSYLTLKACIREER